MGEQGRGGEHRYIQGIFICSSQLTKVIKSEVSRFFSRHFEDNIGLHFVKYHVVKSKDDFGFCKGETWWNVHYFLRLDSGIIKENPVMYSIKIPY